jgi:hypothetical protein
MNITGNIISGQVTGETAKQLSDRFGKIMQDRSSLSINRNDASISRSKQLDSAIPDSTIAALSSGEFVGMVADDPDNKINLKTFHSSFQNKHAELAEEQKNYKPLPVIQKVTNAMVQMNYIAINKEIADLVNAEIQNIMRDPNPEDLIIKKG